MSTDPEDAAMTAFGSRVQADWDLDLVDSRVSHVHDVQYGPGSNPPDVFRAVSVAAPFIPSHGRAWGRTVAVVLACFAVAALAGFAGVFFLTR